MATEHEEKLGTEDSKWLGEYSQVHMNVFGTPLRVMDHGQGAHIWDVDGNEYLDFLAGIAVNSLGYAHPKWVKAVADQAAKVAHISNYFASEPQIELASKLVKLAGAPEGSKVYFGNSGAEGNEAALKLAKLYGRTLPGALPSIGGKPARILAMTHGFHGRTMGALSATWKPGIRKPYDPLVPNIEFVRAGDKVALHDAFAQTGLGRYGKGPVAAVILELIQGEAGVQPLGADYVKFVRELCDINHALLIIDEVQTGIGRTGKWFAFQRDDLSGGVTPDMVTFAKGVAGGFPMGGMIAFELRGGLQAGVRFMDALQLVTRAVSLGDAETLAQHPASMTHSTYTPEQRAAHGIAEGLVRLSVGLEDLDDLLADIGQALDLAHAMDLSAGINAAISPERAAAAAPFCSAPA